MSINLSVPQESGVAALKPHITVIGVGGAGGNAVDNMIQSQLEGVDFVVANTDAQALALSKADHRIQLGVSLTKGLGAGSRPDIGRAAAEEALEEVVAELDGVNMVFIAAGMGGGTGTGATPVIARAARDAGILTVGVVTKPFQFEGFHRMRLAVEGIAELEQVVDTLIIIPNQNLFRVANEKTTFADAFRMADRVLYSGVRGVTDLMVMPGLINLDFADIRSVMGEMGKAMMGTGEAEGERRALDAAEAAIANPLLDDTSMKGAGGVLINITGGPDMTLFEVDEAANRIRAEVDNEAYIIFGSAFDEDLEGRIRVSVVATGIDAVARERVAPTVLDVVEYRRTPAVERRPVPAAADLPAPVSQPATGEEASTAAAAGAIEAGEEKPWAEVDTGIGDGEADPSDEAETPVATTGDGTVTGTLSTRTEDDDPSADVTAADRGTPVPASPTAGAMDAFIPPAPAKADEGAAAGDADPFAEADVVNEPRPAKGRDRPLSLFEKVTGSRRGKKLGKVRELIEKHGISGEDPEPASEPAGDGPAPVVGAAATSDGDSAGSAENAEQGRLGGLDAADRLWRTDAEEDLLEIPAFLRRQAN